ncbi:MAG: NUDIX hydrolase [Lentisphaeria bacterium]|nr:NUDIX hydrolase [Lentisphaeria bacterium]
MHRNNLLQQLKTYLEKYPAERGMTQRYIDFVKAHEDCFERSLLIGHVTGSAFVVNKAGTHTLLTHHKKLNIWVQPGGHADGETNVMKVAMTEAKEETGLAALEFVSSELFDVDIHAIPERKDIPAHEHFDCRFVIQSQGSDEYVVSEESHDLAWIPITKLADFTQEESMLRMAKKWLTSTSGIID